jgi:hypothetical protein
MIIIHNEKFRYKENEYFVEYTSYGNNCNYSTNLRANIHINKDLIRQIIFPVHNQSLYENMEKYLTDLIKKVKKELFLIHKLYMTVQKFKQTETKYKWEEGHFSSERKYFELTEEISEGKIYYRIIFDYDKKEYEYAYIVTRNVWQDHKAITKEEKVEINYIPLWYAEHTMKYIKNEWVNKTTKKIDKILKTNKISILKLN